jgi:hypothetical protein
MRSRAPTVPGEAPSRQPLAVPAPLDGTPPPTLMIIEPWMAFYPDAISGQHHDPGWEGLRP